MNFEYLSSGHYIYVSKDVRIRGYFSKPKGIREQKLSGKTVINDMDFKIKMDAYCIKPDISSHIPRNTYIGH